MDTIFFGGGTPTVLPVPLLIKLLHASRESLDIEDGNPEISLEVNPATVGQDDLSALFQAGFNRLSIGIQSFADKELQALGRPHTAAEAQQALVMARRAGFANISLDLMYGLPGQGLSSWRKSLLTALELEPEHLSIYELTIEEGTVFADLLRQGRLTLPGEEEIMAMMEMTIEHTGKKGFRRYEISNYAKPGRECLHNMNYWKNGSYVGIGAGAVSCLSGKRFSTIEDVEKYCRLTESGNLAIGEIEVLDREARFRETVIMGLRMTDGVSISELEKRFGLNMKDYYGDLLEELHDAGLLDDAGGFLRLTEHGFMFANRVMAELV